MSDAESRSRFEAWAVTYGLNTAHYMTGYSTTATDDAWATWKAGWNAAMREPVKE